MQWSSILTLLSALIWAGRLWLLSHGLFPALTSPCSWIPWIVCQSSLFLWSSFSVLHSRRPQQLSLIQQMECSGSFWKCTIENIPLTCCQCKRNMQSNIPSSASSFCSRWVFKYCPKWLAFSLLVAWLKTSAVASKLTHAWCLFIVTSALYMCVELQGIAEKTIPLTPSTPVFIAETFDIAQLTGTNCRTKSVWYLYPPSSSHPYWSCEICES